VDAVICKPVIHLLHLRHYNEVREPSRQGKGFVLPSRARVDANTSATRQTWFNSSHTTVESIYRTAPRCRWCYAMSNVLKGLGAVCTVATLYCLFLYYRVQLIELDGRKPPSHPQVLYSTTVGCNITIRNFLHRCPAVPPCAAQQCCVLLPQQGLFLRVDGAA
jgi:hypothetical protein